MRIAGRPVGEGSPCFVIAEAGVNHNGDVVLARKLVDAAADAGADAVKFQTFRADLLVSASAPKAEYQLAHTSRAESQSEMLQRLELGASEVGALAEHARGRGIHFASTPFDVESADLVLDSGAPFIKISSGDLTFVPLLRHVARLGRPIILSTGMSDMEEVAAAVDLLRASGAGDIALLQCVSEYPAPAAEANLRAMASMRQRFGTPVGYSDHTRGLEIAVAAVALGASILEKHLTLDRSLPGPDHQASLEPQEFAELVRQVRSVEAAMGDGVKAPAPSERANRTVVRRSLFAARDLAAGTVLTSEMLACRRPGDGLPASEFDAVVGRRLARPLRAGERIRSVDLA